MNQFTAFVALFWPSLKGAVIIGLAVGLAILLCLAGLCYLEKQYKKETKNEHGIHRSYF